MEIATLTAKGQVTVPKAVRGAFGLKQGDQLIWELEDGSVWARAVAPLDVADLRVLEGMLSGWSSPAEAGVRGAMNAIHRFVVVRVRWMAINP